MSGCEEVREILVAAARGESVSAPGQRFLREHVEECPQCRRNLANQRMLSAGLSVMAAAHAGAPSDAVKEALLAEFRRRRVVTPIRSPRFPRTWVAIAAVAAALLLAIFVAQRRHAGPERVTQPVPLQVAITPPSGKAQPVTVATVKAKPQPARRRRVAPPPVVRDEEPTEIATDFFEIPYVEPLRPEERADVFRIQMPRASMAVFGLPVTGGRLDTRITADVLMGEDGVARAIRFIR